MEPNYTPNATAPVSGSQSGGTESGNRDTLRNIAKYQKGIIFCILAQLITVAGQIIMPASMALVGSALVVVASLLGAVYLIMLATQIYSAAASVVLAILALIPFVGFIVLLVVNSKATRILKDNGIHVGFMGVNMSTFE